MKKTLDLLEKIVLLNKLKERFNKNMNRHMGLVWDKVRAKLEANEVKVYILSEMEKSGGEPDVVAFIEATGEYVFFDCAAESPKGRRSLCYDRAALDARKENKPANSAMDMANAMGISLLNEAEYVQLQNTGKYDTKTSSWLITPENIRQLGGAIFGDNRYDTVFIYHNGADSYYDARGFRGKLNV